VGVSAGLDPGGRVVFVEFGVAVGAELGLGFLISQGVGQG